MSQLDDFELALQGFSSAIVGISNRKVDEATTADNALALNGTSASDLITTAAAHTDAHAARTDNPHDTTAEQLGAYTTGTVDAMFKNCVPAGFLALSGFGEPDDTPLSVTVDATNLQVTFDPVKCMLSGQAFQIAPPAIAITTGVNNYLYLRMVAGQATIVVQTTVTAESSSNMLIGVVRVDSGTVTTNTLSKVMRLGNYRVSTVAVGSAIPVSVGDPSVTGAHLQWT
jgi:hypothetical protein